jgi:Caspase domain
MNTESQVFSDSLSGKKIALVIGNSDYNDGDEVSGVKDAEALAEVLGGIGFKVLPVLKNKDLDETTTALRNFQQEIKDATVVVFFYSGHGFQSNGNNFLVPIGGSIEPSSCLPLKTVVQGMVLAPNAVKIIFLDACRTQKDLPEGALQGLAEALPAPPDVLQAFAASPNQVAASGSGDGLSPYTMALVHHIAEPGLQIGEFFAKVHNYLDGARQLPTEVSSGFPPGFSFADPVFLKAEVMEAVDSLFVLLNGDIVLDSSHPPFEPIRLKGGENDLVLIVSNGKRHRNGHDWDVTEGWRYMVKLSVSGQGEWAFEDHEDIPFKNGPHHGGVFTVAKAKIIVQSNPLTVTLENREDKIWETASPFWAREQDLLSEQRITDLPLDKILDPQKLPDFGIIPAATMSVLLRELLTTGKFLDQRIADPAQTFFVVRGNRAFKELVQICIKDQEDDRVRDLHASIVAALNRNPRPFDIFIDGLNRSLQDLARARGMSPDDARVWTAIEDRSDILQPVLAPGGASRGVGTESSRGSEVVRASRAPSVASLSRARARAVSEAASTSDPLFQKQPDEIFAVPIPFDRVVQGVPLSAPAYAFMSIRSIDGKVRVNVRSVADLSDLQTKIGALVDLLPLPTNQCEELNAVNNVVRIWGKKITIDGEVANLELHGDVDGWFCAKGVPCSKVVWHGLIPEVVLFDCNPPITKQVFNQPFDANIPFGLGVADRLSLEVRLGQPTVSLGGQLGGVTEGILRIAGVDLNDKLREALSGVVNPDLLKGTLPEDLLQLDPVVTRAGLFSSSGALAASVELNVPFDLRIFKALAEALAKLRS